MLFKYTAKLKLEKNRYENKNSKNKITKRIKYFSLSEFARLEKEQAEKHKLHNELESLAFEAKNLLDEEEIVGYISEDEKEKMLKEVRLFRMFNGWPIKFDIGFKDTLWLINKSNDSKALVVFQKSLNFKQVPICRPLKLATGWRRPLRRTWLLTNSKSGSPLWRTSFDLSKRGSRRPRLDFLNFED